MKKEEILKLLSQIKYPGFSRDIVSFGMVKDIGIEEKTIHITLNISTNENDVKNQLRQSIEEIIKKNTYFENVGVFIIQPDTSNKSESNTHQLDEKNGTPFIKHITCDCKWKRWCWKIHSCYQSRHNVSSKLFCGIA